MSAKPHIETEIETGTGTWTEAETTATQFNPFTDTEHNPAPKQTHAYPAAPLLLHLMEVVGHVGTVVVKGVLDGRAP